MPPFELHIQKNGYRWEVDASPTETIEAIANRLAKEHCLELRSVVFVVKPNFAILNINTK